MPANLTPVYREAEASFKAAVTREEKLAALEEMLRVIPKHKGTEKLQADLRSRISKLKREPAKKAGARGSSHRIPAEGAGQVVLVGPPNTGKSALVAHLTHAHPAVADYPMTTREATPGMMPFGDIAFQLVDLPPLCDDHVDAWVYDLIRGGDLAWIVAAVDDPPGALELMQRLLRAKAIQLVPAAAVRSLDGDGMDATTTASADRIDRDSTDRAGWTRLPAIVVVTGMDRPGAHEDLALAAELIGDTWPCVGVSTLNGEGLGVLGDRTFDALDVIRVYTKEPGHEPDKDRPFTLPRGATVGALARTIHGELAEQLKHARVWGASVFDGQRVRADHVLDDGDVVELRT